MQLFKHIDEVQENLKSLWRQSGLPEPDFSKGGYPLSDIAELEQTLDLKFHISFRKVLEGCHLDPLEFHTIHFGNNYLATIGAWEFNSQNEDQFFIVIASADGYSILLDNHNGHIYFAEECLQIPVYVAPDLDNFIRVAASILYATANFYSGEDENEAEIAGGLDSFFKANSIQSGYEFWRMLALRVI